MGIIGLLMAGPVFAAQWVIDDNYIGGGATGYQQKNGDVVAYVGGYEGEYVNETDLFDITGMTVDIDNDQNITVVIKTDYTPGVAIDDDTDYGDLFISIDGWSPTGNTPYETDTFYSQGTTDWEYAFDTSSGNIYSATDQGLFLSNDAGEEGGTDGGGAWAHNWYRRDQLVQYNPATGETDVGTGTFTALGNSILTYSFNLGDLGLSAQEGYDLGFRWTMTCANDVIEGGVSMAPVPEPGTVMLLGLGLLGMGAVGRKKLKKT